MSSETNAPRTPTSPRRLHGPVRPRTVPLDAWSTLVFDGRTWEPLSPDEVGLKRHAPPIGSGDIRPADARRQALEGWMLRRVRLPVELLGALWMDAGWRSLLENLIVQPWRPGGRAGMLRAIDPGSGLGMLGVDGRLRWTRPDGVTCVHPLHLDGGFERLVELGFLQGVPQIYRERIVRVPSDTDRAHATSAFAGAAFAQGSEVVALARSLGCRIRGSEAVLAVCDEGRGFEAVFAVGVTNPDTPACTGDLWFLCGSRRVRLGDVPPIAWSEGVRMARWIHRCGQWRPPR
jgi:hypothetical protein